MEIPFIGGQSSQIEDLIRQYMAIESRPVDTLKRTKETLSVRSAMFQDLNSSLLALKNASEALIPTGDMGFYSAKTVISGDSSVFTAQAESSAQEAAYNLFVERLACSDTVVSKRFSSELTGISESAGYGDKTFTVEVGGESWDITVFVAEGEDNSTVFANLAREINSSEAGVHISATVVSEKVGVSRLVIESKVSGSENAITLGEEGGENNILEYLGLSSEVQSSGENGGYLVSRDLLDAKFNLNGLSFIRSSNIVDDAISGVTLTLKKAQDPGAASVSLEVKPDTNVIKSKIKAFITSFNDTVKFLENKTMVDAHAGVRGDLAGEAVYLNLKTQMARAVQGGIGVAGSQGVLRLNDIGVTRDRTGRLSLEDESKLNKALLENPDGVFDLLSSENGVAAKVRNLMDPFVKSAGIIDRQRKSITGQIRTIDSRVKNLNERLEMREKALRTQFSSLLQAYTLVTTQSAMLNSFMTQSYMQTYY